jgi:hypothetical protein
LKHTASKRFWQCLESLPADVQDLAHRSYALLKTVAGGVHWFWIGSHREYDKLVA